MNKYEERNCDYYYALFMRAPPRAEQSSVYICMRVRGRLRAPMISEKKSGRSSTLLDIYTHEVLELLKRGRDREVEEDEVLRIPRVACRE